MTNQLCANDIRRLFRADNLKAQDERGYTCLHWLVVTGHNRLLYDILQQPNIDPTIRDAQSMTALDHACKLGRLHMTRTLVQAFPHLLHSRRPSDGRTPLHFANESLQPSVMVTCLLELGADINAASTLGRTVLHEAILRGSTVEHLGYLVAYGAHIYARDVHGWTPLHYAAYMGHVDLVEQLLYYGADPQAADEQGRTPLHVTAGKVFLKEWDLDVVAANLECNEATPALRQATEWSRSLGRRTSSDIVRLLLQHGARTWETDKDQNLTVSLAARTGEVDVTYDILRVAAMEGLFG